MAAPSGRVWVFVTVMVATLLVITYYILVVLPNDWQLPEIFSGDCPDPPAATSSAPRGSGRLLHKLPNVTVSFSMSIVSTKDLRDALSHLLRTTNYAFDDVYLVYDTTPSGVPDPEVIAALEAFKREKLIMRYVTTDATKEGIDALYDTIHGPGIRIQHHVADNVTLPVKNAYGKGQYVYMVEMEECKTDYCVHLDDDVSVYTERNFSWVEECILRMQHWNAHLKPLEEWKNTSTMVNNKEGQLIDPSLPVALCIPSLGPYYRGPPLKPFFSHFFDVNTKTLILDGYSSRWHLFNNQYYKAMKPIGFSWGAFWEHMLTSALRLRKFNRMDLLYGAWVLHSYVRGEGLHNIRRCVERGVYPADQEGEEEASRSLRSAEHWPVCAPDNALDT